MSDAPQPYIVPDFTPHRAKPGCLMFVFGTDGYTSAIFDEHGRDLLPSMGAKAVTVKVAAGEPTSATIECTSVEAVAEVLRQHVTIAAPITTDPKEK